MISSEDHGLLVILHLLCYKLVLHSIGRVRGKSVNVCDERKKLNFCPDLVFFFFFFEPFENFMIQQSAQFLFYVAGVLLSGRPLTGATLFGT